MNIFESIKPEKKMSFSHWRYRTLHWCFDEEAERPESSSLPQFLYTHYCPLFHLTNLIVVLLPLIILAKIGIVIVLGLKKMYASIHLRAIIEDFKIKRRAKAQREPTEEHRKATALREEKKVFLYLMLNTDRGVDGFERFWDDSDFHFVYFQKEQSKQFYVTRIIKIVEAKKLAAQHKEAMRQRLIFWTNFSHVFFKWFFNIAYLCLALFVLWVLWQVIPPTFSAIVDIIKLLMTFNPIPMFLFIGKILVIAVAVVAVIYGFRSQISQKCVRAIGSSVVAVSPPFVLLGQWVALPLKWISQTFVNTVDFVEMFYEENCPPITIVSDEDEIIAGEVE